MKSWLSWLSKSVANSFVACSMLRRPSDIVESALESSARRDAMFNRVRSRDNVRRFRMVMWKRLDDGSLGEARRSSKDMDRGKSASVVSEGKSELQNRQPRIRLSS